MIYITGDTHNNFTRFTVDNFPEQRELTKNDYVIACGDFGFVWDYRGETKQEKYWLDWLEEKPFTILFVDGNHENFERLYTYPVKNWHGDKVHEISPSILHLMRGEIFEIDGRRILAFGGAKSHDIRDGILDPVKDIEKIKKWSRDYTKMFRINKYSWWKQEMPTEEEKQNCLKNIKDNNTVDFVVAHCCPQTIASILSNGCYRPDDLTMWFQKLLKSGLQFDRWFFGHYHEDRQIMTKFICLYEQIVRIA